ncbi:MAG: TlpA family protein disulfide reductase [Solirubrobacterales bacterium]|nr:TlpA family protein disulfide reductase [Solirubrobacterales bacterium]
MPEDRFGDLGGPDRRSAAERLEEQDRINPEPDDPRRRPPVPPRRSSRWAWTVGFLAIMAVGIVVVTATSVRDNGEGLGGPPVGTKIPDFAAPSATGNTDPSFGANVRQRTGGSDQAGKVPACELVTEEVVNVCELREQPLVLTFVVTRGADCEPQVDRVERMRAEFPEVNFAVVVSGNDREEVEEIVRRRGWTLPVGVDYDGAVVNLYGIAVCPTTIFVKPGGRVQALRLGNLTEDQLRADVRRLLRQSGS